MKRLLYMSKNNFCSEFLSELVIRAFQFTYLIRVKIIFSGI